MTKLGLDYALPWFALESSELIIDFPKSKYFNKVVKLYLSLLTNI